MIELDDQPDWRPVYSATSFPEGTIKYGSTGQQWQVRNGQWVRLKKLREVRADITSDEAKAP